MRDLATYALNCMEKLDAIGIEYGNILDVTVNTRAKRRWGQCRKTPAGFKININADLLNESITKSDAGLINTLIHEILHTCEGCMNHGPKWKDLAFKVKLFYGIDIKRTSSEEEKGLTTTSVRRVEYPYAVQCTCCKQVTRRTKKSKVIMHPEYYRCAMCGGNLVRIK